MITLRKSSERGNFNHGWLNTFHTFSFAEYYDTEFMGFSSLRVINEDFISAGRGFPLHGHKDMEIVTLVIEGALEHKDTLGNSAIIRPGEVQRMTAGTGIRHSEANALKDQTAHIMQIWILPDSGGHTPGYEQKSFSDEFEKGKLVLVASPDGQKGSVSIHQDAKIYQGRLNKDSEHKLELGKNRCAWIQVISGQVKIEGVTARAGDGAAIDEVENLKLNILSDSDVVIFNLTGRILEKEAGTF